MKKLLFVALPFLLLSCSSDNDNTYVPPIETPSGNAYSYMRGTMNGTPFDYTYKLNNPNSDIAYGAMVNISQLGFDRWFSYGGQFSPEIMSDERIYISFANVFSGSYEEESVEFHNAFETIATNYLDYNEDNVLHYKGIDVGYQASEGVYYYSTGGSQTGSTFTITDTSEGTEGGLKTKTVVGTFNCKLYNQDNAADVKTITNGTFKVVLREDF